MPPLPLGTALSASARNWKPSFPNRCQSRGEAQRRPRYAACWWPRWPGQQVTLPGPLKWRIPCLPIIKYSFSMDTWGRQLPSLKMACSGNVCEESNTGVGSKGQCSETDVYPECFLPEFQWVLEKSPWPPQVWIFTAISSCCLQLPHYRCLRLTTAFTPCSRMWALIKRFYTLCLEGRFIKTGTECKPWAYIKPETTALKFC